MTACRHLCKAKVAEKMAGMLRISPSCSRLGETVVHFAKKKSLWMIVQIHHGPDMGHADDCATTSYARHAHIGVTIKLKQELNTESTVLASWAPSYKRVEIATVYIYVLYSD